MNAETLLGVCGLYCGSCDHYRAGQPDGKPLLDKIRLSDPRFEVCEGCRSKKLTTSCANCAIRDCADTEGIKHCALCGEYPCDQLKAFQFDGRIHHIVVIDNLENLKRQGSERWLQEQENRWKCECGANFSWYEDHCRQCGRRLASYGNPLTNSRGR